MSIIKVNLTIHSTPWFFIKKNVFFFLLNVMLDTKVHEDAYDSKVLGIFNYGLLCQHSQNV